MEISVITNICLCILSFLLAVVSVVTVIVGLKQNSRMLENESRAYVAIYGEITYTPHLVFYLIVKNFGKSSASIISFECDRDLSIFAYIEKFTPFSHMENISIAPGQSFRCALQHFPLFGSGIPSINFKITYKSNNKIYSEDFSVVLKAYTNLVNTKSSSQEEPLRTISHALEDINKRLL